MKNVCMRDWNLRRTKDVAKRDIEELFPERLDSEKEERNYEGK